MPVVILSDSLSWLKWAASAFGAVGAVAYKTQYKVFLSNPWRNYTGWPRKTWNGIMIAITGISVWGNLSWEKKWYQNHSRFGSVFCFLGHILWDNVETQNFPYSAKTSSEWMPFRLSMVGSSNPINCSIPLLTMHVNKVKWINAHNCGKPKWHSFTPTLSWKEKFWGLDIVSQNVP